MTCEFPNCPKCGKQGRVASVAIHSWFPSTPSGFVESLSWRQTSENLWSRIKKVKDARGWAVLPLLAALLFYKELPAIANMILILTMIAIYVWAAGRRESDIRKIIDDFFPNDEFDWEHAALSTKAAIEGLFCNMCGLCWERDTGRLIAFYNEQSEYRLHCTGDPSCEAESYDDE